MMARAAAARTCTTAMTRDTSSLQRSDLDLYLMFQVVVDLTATSPLYKTPLPSAVIEPKMGSSHHLIYLGVEKSWRNFSSHPCGSLNRVSTRTASTLRTRCLLPISATPHSDHTAGTPVSGSVA